MRAVSIGTQRHEHLVQFYGSDDARLVRNVARFLQRSLDAGGGALVIAGENRRAAIARELSSDCVIYLDARETLAGLLGSDKRPDAARFAASAGKLARDLIRRFGYFNGYGEMVGLLWAQRSYAAAAALEAMWNELLEHSNFGIFCGYPIDVLSQEFQIASMEPLLSSHTRLVPALPFGFDIAIRQAMDEVLGARGEGLRPVALTSFRAVDVELPAAEQTILRLRSSLPRYADRIIEQARSYCGA
jgi:hypothetical protein